MKDLVVKGLIIGLPITLGLLLLGKYLNPSGSQTYQLVMGQQSPYIQRLLPDSRVSSLEIGESGSYVSILDEPVYFSVIPPLGSYTDLQLSLAFDPGLASVVELGGLTNLAAQAFAFQPLSNSILNQLDWSRTDLGNGLTLFTRPGAEPMADTIFTQPPDQSQVAVYKTDFPGRFRIQGYSPSSTSKTYQANLRGPHELYTYIDKEEFNLTVSYTDINRTFGPDEGWFKVYDAEDQLMTQVQLVDDGNGYDNQVASKLTDINITAKDWPAGVYRVELSGTSDLIWRTLTTTQKYLVVKNQVFIGDFVGQRSGPVPMTLFTNAKRVTYETQHVEGLQTIQTDQQATAVQVVGDKYPVTITTPGVVKIFSPVGDVKMTGEGKYAFTYESWFDPDPVAVTPWINLETSEVNYVLANLPAAKYQDDWLTAAANFKLSNLVQENGAYKFALSIPDLQGDTVKVHAIQVQFSKQQVTLKQMYKDFKHLIKLLLP